MMSVFRTHGTSLAARFCLVYFAPTNAEFSKKAAELSADLEDDGIV